MASSICLGQPTCTGLTNTLGLMQARKLQVRNLRCFIRPGLFPEPVTIMCSPAGPQAACRDQPFERSLAGRGSK